MAEIVNRRRALPRHLRPITDTEERMVEAALASKTQPVVASFIEALFGRPPRAEDA